MIQQMVKKKAAIGNREIYAYEYRELLPNEGWVQETNQWISDKLSDGWESTKDAIAHVFQDSNGGKTTVTAAAVGYYVGSWPGAGVAAASERGYACFNCHVSTPVGNTLETAIDFVVSQPDSTSK